MTTIQGIHHVKIPVGDLERSRRWYERVLPLEVQLEFRDDDGTVRGVAYHDINGFALALREDPLRAEALCGFNPVAVLVDGPEELRVIAAQLDDLGEPYLGPLEATLGWLLGLTDPDGIELRFYTRRTRVP